MNTITEDFITAADGTRIGYRIMGKGPAILIIHGTYRAGKHYIKMADHIANDFTLYLMDRRGRGLSGQKGDQYTLQTEIDDATAIMKKHDIKLLFGHSYGGLVSFGVALQYPMAKLAVFEAAACVVNGIPIGWMPDFEKSLSKEDYTGAMVIMSKSIGMIPKEISWVPFVLLRWIFNRMSKNNKDWNEDKLILKTVPGELQTVNKWDAENRHLYKNIDMPVLILAGDRSPQWLLDAMQLQHQQIRTSKLIIMPGLLHNSPDEFAPEKVGDELIKFFKS